MGLVFLEAVTTTIPETGLPDWALIIIAFGGSKLIEYLVKYWKEKNLKADARNHDFHDKFIEGKETLIGQLQNQIDKLEDRIKVLEKNLKEATENEQRKAQEAQEWKVRYQGVVTSLELLQISIDPDRPKGPALIAEIISRVPKPNERTDT